MKGNLDRYILIMVIILFAVLLGLYAKDTLKKKNKLNFSNEVVEKIEGYDYSIKNNSPDLYKEKFLELKDILTSANIDEEKYVKLIAELFIIDFYTLDSKVNNNDIGGIDFVLPSIRDNFILKSNETLYKYVENSIYGEKKEMLPVVKEVTISSIKNVNYTYENKIDKDAYEIKLNWIYEEDLGYESAKTLYFVHQENKLYLVEMS